MSQTRRRAAVKSEAAEVPAKKHSTGKSSGEVKAKKIHVEEEGEIVTFRSRAAANNKGGKKTAGVKDSPVKEKTVKGKKRTIAETKSTPNSERAVNLPIEEEEYTVEIVPPQIVAKTNGETSDEEEDTYEALDEDYEDPDEEEDMGGSPDSLRGNYDIDALMESALQEAQNGGSKDDGSQKRTYKREFNIPCAYCEVMLKDYGYLFRHVSRLHKKEPDVDEYLNEIRPRMRAACPVCNKTVSSASNVSAHMKQCHAGEECSVKCPLCNKVYKTQISLKQHLRQCHQPQVRKHQCSHCDMSFTESRSLKEHINCTHETTQIFRCDDCGKTFLTKGRLRRHKYIHSDFRHYCNYCKKGFHLKDNMNKHVEIMHEKKFGKRFQCPHCPKNFTVKGNMKQHILGVHLRQYAYNCPICGEGYRRKKDMLIHMEQHKEGMSTLKIEDVKIDPHTIKLPPPSVKVQMAPSDGMTTGTTVIEVLPQNIKVLTE